MSNFKRKKQKIKDNPSALLLSDWHLRESIPTCRTDNFWEAQNDKTDFIIDLAKRHNIPILVGGDLGHKAKWSCKLLEWAIEKFKNVEIFVIAGQHDLPQHQTQQWRQSGIGVLHAAGAIKFIQQPETLEGKNITIFPFSFGQEMINPDEFKKNNKLIAVTHQMVIENKPLWPGQEAPKGHQLLKEFPEYDLILSGDNHLSFISEYKNRVLCNPGSIMRTTAAQVNHKPRIYLWYAETNEIQVIYLPINQNVISREHIGESKQKKERMDSYLKRIDSYLKGIRSDVEIELSFEQNISEYFQKNRTQIPIKNKVFEAME